VVVLLPERIEIMKVAWGLDSHTSDQEPTPPEKPEQKGMFDEPNEG
jgi:hypothetical protein